MNVVLARHWTLDIPKIKLQKIECRAGKTLDIGHSKNKTSDKFEKNIQ